MSEKDVGCSQRAISVARVIDRLEPGEYIVSLVKPGNGEGDYWSVDISKKETVDRKVLGKRDRS